MKTSTIVTIAIAIGVILILIFMMSGPKETVVVETAPAPTPAVNGIPVPPTLAASNGMMMQAPVKAQAPSIQVPEQGLRETAFVDMVDSIRPARLHRKYAKNWNRKAVTNDTFSDDASFISSKSWTSNMDTTSTVKVTVMPGEDETILFDPFTTSTVYLWVTNDKGETTSYEVFVETDETKSVIKNVSEKCLMGMNCPKATFVAGKDNTAVISVKEGRAIGHIKTRQN